ncbi:BLUF domain-containing protein [Desertivirga brevis]|uniref:BLUF domain-containing protein n=1 Tax=Desertivirga brevis TaxID=2810310 RepID=UPI001A96B546|nr:BLUF domain-containing protein [Pedobacter sp. SYSU D00873]
MYYLIYRSQAKGNMDHASLKSILTSSQRHNQETNITGMLVYFDNKFLQLVEGDEILIKAVFEKIKQDKRHHNLSILKEGHIERRLFPGWSMSFRTPSPEEIAKEPGYKDIYKPGSPGAFDLVSLFNLLRGKKDEKAEFNLLR